MTSVLEYCTAKKGRETAATPHSCYRNMGMACSEVSGESKVLETKVRAR